jgi:hypothetical protein
VYQSTWENTSGLASNGIQLRLGALFLGWLIIFTSTRLNYEWLAVNKEKYLAILKS